LTILFFFYNYYANCAHSLRNFDLRVSIMQIKKRLLNGILTTVAVTAICTSIVYAGTRYEGYNTTVGRLNGSGYTGSQTKVTSGANGMLISKYVGGDYRVDARMIDNDDEGAWEYNIGDWDVRSLDGHKYHAAGDSVRVEFSNDWDTWVNVQVEGNWLSN